MPSHSTWNWSEHTPHTHTAILQKHDSISTILLKDKYRPSRQERTMKEMHDGSFYEGSFITDHFQFKKRHPAFLSPHPFEHFLPFHLFPICLSMTTVNAEVISAAFIALPWPWLTVIFLFFCTNTFTHTICSPSQCGSQGQQRLSFSSWMLGNLKDLTCEWGSNNSLSMNMHTLAFESQEEVKARPPLSPAL